MTRLFIYLLLFGTVLYLLSTLGRRQNPESQAKTLPKVGKWFRPKVHPRDMWIQVYQTASMDEARSLQARLQEEEIDCIIYEQGKKDIHGNEMTGIGIAVPKTATQHSQSIISRMTS